MKHLLLVSIALLGMSPAAFADLTAVLSPNFGVYPPGTDPGTCDTNGMAPCLVFSGTLTDTDTDGSFITINDPGGISLIYGQPSDATYLTLDNTFYNDPPLLFVGDPTSVFIPYTYTGAIFGIDILPTIPLGVYNETAVISGFGGTNDPNGNGFTVDVDFTIEITPEPSPALLMLAGLVAMAVWHRRKRVC